MRNATYPGMGMPDPTPNKQTTLARGHFTDASPSIYMLPERGNARHREKTRVLGELLRVFYE